MQYAQHRGVLTDIEFDTLRELGWGVLIALGDAQQDVAQEEKPVEMYLTALRQLLYQGAIYLRNREHPDMVDKEYPRLSTRAANAEFVGWYATLFHAHELSRLPHPHCRLRADAAVEGECCQQT